MIDFLKAKRGLILGIVLAIAAVAVVAMQVERRSARQEREASERIRKDVRESIDKTMSKLKFCPLSDPDCNKR